MPLPAPLSPLIVDDLVRMALLEDLGHAGISHHRRPSPRTGKRAPCSAPASRA